jgi:hypothetical protein
MPKIHVNTRELALQELEREKAQARERSRRYRARKNAEARGENWQEDQATRICQHCGTSIVGKDPRARFCSTTCRVYAHHKAQPVDCHSPKVEELEKKIATLTAELVEAQTAPPIAAPKPGKPSVRDKVKAPMFSGTKYQVEAFCDNHGIEPDDWNAIYDRLHSDWWEALSLHHTDKVAKILCEVFDNIGTAEDLANTMLVRPWDASHSWTDGLHHKGLSRDPTRPLPAAIDSLAAQIHKNLAKQHPTWNVVHITDITELKPQNCREGNLVTKSHGMVTLTPETHELLRKMWKLMKDQAPTDG